MGAVFGLGTMISPVLALGFLSGGFARREEFRAVIPYVSGVFLMLMGAYIILSGNS
jgi:threonine/homoserine/homoserine lactone efflux protein